MACQLATLGLSSIASMQNPQIWGVRIPARSCPLSRNCKKYSNTENQTLLRGEKILSLHYNAYLSFL